MDRIRQRQLQKMKEAENTSTRKNVDIQQPIEIGNDPVNGVEAIEEHRLSYYPPIMV